MQQLLALPSLDARINFTINEAMRTRLFNHWEDLETLFHMFYKKLIIAEKYIPSTKYKGDMVLIRAETLGIEADKMPHDYSLSQVINQLIHESYGGATEVFGDY